MQDTNKNNVESENYPKITLLSIVILTDTFNKKIDILTINLKQIIS